MRLRKTVNQTYFWYSTKVWNRRPKQIVAEIENARMPAGFFSAAHVISISSEMNVKISPDCNQKISATGEGCMGSTTRISIK